MRELELLNYISIETLFIPLIVGVFLILFIFRLKYDKSFILAVTEEKNRKQNLLNFITDELSGLESHLIKLKRDVEVVDHYNVMHLKQVDTYLTRYMHLYKYLGILDDIVLSTRIKELGLDIKKMAEDINFLEQTIYEARLGFQRYIDQTTAKHEKNTLNAEEYVLELNTQRDKILKFIEQNRTQRYIQFERLEILIRECKNVESDLSSYKKDYVESKHFYVKHMVYA